MSAALDERVLLGKDCRNAPCFPHLHLCKQKEVITYHRMFEAVGIHFPGPDPRDVDWIAMAPDGFPYMMCRKGYFKVLNDGLVHYYEPGHPKMHTKGREANEYLRFLKGYFKRRAPIRLFPAAFKNDGQIWEDGSGLASLFHSASGWVCEARLQEFHYKTGHMIASVHAIQQLIP